MDAERSQALKRQAGNSSPACQSLANLSFYPRRESPTNLQRINPNRRTIITGAIKMTLTIDISGPNAGFEIRQSQAPPSLGVKNPTFQARANPQNAYKKQLVKCAP